ncbi:MAG: 50S ribosomal protein L15 [Elusimicrobiales bacterium]|nr:50S ribosomal protein L15 [Elusimicrobiales bacterium]
MIYLHDLKPKKGSIHKKKRLGTGQGSGHGQTSTRGQKGQLARSGDPKRFDFAGGQMPLLRKIPKRGFNNNSFRKVYQEINISTLEKYFNDGDQITPEVLREKRIIKNELPIKILGDGNITKKLIVSTNAFSKKAKDKIEKVGGKAVVIK